MANANAPQLVGFDQPIDCVRGQSQIFRESFAVKQLPIDARFDGRANDWPLGPIWPPEPGPHRRLLAVPHLYSLLLANQVASDGADELEVIASAGHTPSPVETRSRT